MWNEEEGRGYKKAGVIWCGKIDESSFVSESLIDRRAGQHQRQRRRNSLSINLSFCHSFFVSHRNTLPLSQALCLSVAQSSCVQANYSSTKPECVNCDISTVGVATLALLSHYVRIRDITYQPNFPLAALNKKERRGQGATKEQAKNNNNSQML